MTEDFDFEGAAAAVPIEGPSLDQLQKLMDEIEELEVTITNLEEMAKSATTRYNYIRTTMIPKLLSALQTDEWTNENGTKIKAHTFVSGSLPKEPDARKEAIEYLGTLKNGSDMIKTIITAEFSKGGHNQALAIADDLRQQGIMVEVESGVAAQTLQANVRERRAMGEDVDLKKLGLYAGRIAKITHKKKKKEAK